MESAAMKTYTLLLSLFFLQGDAWVTSAFSISKTAKKVSSARHAFIPIATEGAQPLPLGASPTDGQPAARLVAPMASNLQLSDPSQFEMFPIYPELELIQGAGTVRTYKMPPWTERCQMLFKTNGRPMKASVELWCGPIRTTHKLNMDCEDGNLTPVQATLKFRKADQMLKVTTSDTLDLPILAGVYVPSPERSDELGANTELVWANCSPKEKLRVQGGSTSGGSGAVRYWTIPDNVKSVQLLAWARDTGKKSFRANIEVLQGPNTPKQSYFLQCGGGSQPYHAVFQTPGPGTVIRIQNKKFLEDGLVEFAILPYDVIKEGEIPELPMFL